MTVPLAIKAGAKKAPLPPVLKKFLMGNFINFTGIVSAGILNLVLARNETFRTGIYAFEDIEDPSTKVPFKSVRLGRVALR